MSTVINSRDDWKQLSNNYYTGKTNDPDITVYLNRPDSSLEDISALRYFFPLAHSLLTSNRAKTINLNIEFHPDYVKQLEIQIEKGKEVDITQIMFETEMRLQAFLCYAASLPEYKIKIFGKDYTGDSPLALASRIFPLLELCGDSSGHPSRMHYSELRAPSQTDSQTLPFFKDFREALKQKVLDIRNYSGTTSCKMYEEQKLDFKTIIAQQLEHWLPNMDTISEIIWLYILRELIMEKQLWSSTGHNQWELNTVVLEKSRMDAVAYGEGTFQLIENACLHSCGKMAWFSLRMYRAGKAVSMSSFFEEATTRDRLYKKYRGCFEQKAGTASSDSIFNKSYRFFFELFVLDDAHDKSGIVPSYRNTFIRKHYKALYDQERSIRYRTWIKENKGREPSDATPFDMPEYSENLSVIDHLWEMAEKVAEEKGLLPNKKLSISDVIMRPPALAGKASHVRDPSLVEQHIEDIITHYGLRLLYHIVQANNGYLVCYSPNEMRRQQFFSGSTEDVDKDVDDEKHYVTEWYALMPISYEWPPISALPSISHGGGLYGDRITKCRSEYRRLDIDSVLGDLHLTAFSSVAEKIGAVKSIAASLENALGNVSDLSDAVIAMYIGDHGMQNMELISKAIFSYISRTRNLAAVEPKELRIALCFPNMDICNEFVRLFGIYYYNGEQADMENTQIAICSWGDGDIYRVNYVLAGKNLSSVVATALASAHFDCLDTLERLPVLVYLTLHDHPGSIEQNIFPFDLYLKDDDGGETSVDLWRNTWFLKQMHHILETEIHGRGQGCVINDIHIRLGSKIHLSRFFEAQLLFHNSNNLFRFAYLITHDLLFGLNALTTDRQILLIGYETYSVQLLQQIAYWLKNSHLFQNVYSAVVCDRDDEGEVLFDAQFDFNRFSTNKPTEIVTILPVGTTLSTIYKIRNSAIKHLPLSDDLADYSRNYCIVLANQELDPGKELSALTKRYWDANREKREVTLKSDGRNNKVVAVKYLLPVSSEWHAAENCVLCRTTARNIRPLISTTKSEFMPSSIFLMRDKRSGYFHSFLRDEKKNKERGLTWDENSRKLNTLLGHITYSHIYKRSNHYQYLLDFDSFYAENREQVLDSIKNDTQWRIEPGTYNLVLSPLQVENALFLQDVLDHVFHGNAQLIHMDFSKAYREEVRAKYSYISEEIATLKRANPNAKICVYYVHTSIVARNILTRAKLLLEMLFAESGTSIELNRFDKVFLLVNRCSFDTARSLVHSPKRDDPLGIRMCAYIHLNVPSFNVVDDGRCPACRLAARYRRLKNRSSTERLSKVFFHLETKHRKRAPAEYDQWLTTAILNSPSYFNQLKSWLFINVPGTKAGNILSFVPLPRTEEDGETAYKLKEYLTSFNDSIRMDFDKCRSFEETQKALDSISNHTLADLIHHAASEHFHEHGASEDQTERFRKQLEDSAVSLVKREIISIRNYMRLICTHQAYMALEPITGHSEDKYLAARRTMLKLISSAVTSDQLTPKGLSAYGAKRFRFAQQMEWLISYLKVLSREHISNHYVYRQAIVGIMSDMLTLMSTEKKMNLCMPHLQEEDDSWKPIIALAVSLHPSSVMRSSSPEVEPVVRVLYQYQITMTLIHRLADLQVFSILEADFIRELTRGYHRLLDACLKKKGDGYILAKEALFVSPPSMETAITRYLKSLKAAAMITSDDIPSLNLTRTVKQLSSFIKAENSHPGTTLAQPLMMIGRYIFLENIQIIYAGLHALTRHIPAAKWDELEKYRPVDDFQSNMSILNDCVEDYIRSSYGNLDFEAKEENLLYQSPFSRFCLFWHKSHGCPPTQLEDGAINPIAYMLQYFKRLNDLHRQGFDAPRIDDLPYLYEELCRLICGFTGAKMCYFVYCSNSNYPEIFAQSGYYIPYYQNFQGKRILTTKDIDIILQQVCIDDSAAGIGKATSPKYECMQLIPGIAQLSYAGHGILAVKISLLPGHSENKHFHIILQHDAEFEHVPSEQIDAPALKQARDILFMRETLQEVFTRHYAVLLSLRFDCSYVRPMVAPLPYDIPRPAVLHLSDAHVHKPFSEYTPDIREAITGRIRDALKEEGNTKIDLLTVTGDIVDGQAGDSTHMEQNYRNAEKLLNAIVIELWQDSENYLPHDWKRRVIITTGNHDYAAMNQFKAQLKQRVLSVGTPIDEESSTMSKFAYYIDFLIRYIDPPIDELLRNDLNEIRYYRCLNMKVLTLNCTGTATPRRTNKLGPNYEIIRDLTGRRIWSGIDESSTLSHHAASGSHLAKRPFRLCLAHYSSQYELSYFEDNYELLPGWAYDKDKKANCVVNRLADYFLQAIRLEAAYINATIAEYPTEAEAETNKRNATEALFKARGLLQKEYEICTKAIELWKAGEDPVNPETDLYFDHFKRLEKELRSISKPQEFADRFTKNALFKEITYYVNWIRVKEKNEHLGDRTDEHISRLIHEIHEYQTMSFFDKNQYAKLFQDEGGSCRNDLMLAGHIHVYAESDLALVSKNLFEEHDSKVNVSGYIIRNLLAPEEKDTKLFEHSRL